MQSREGNLIEALDRVDEFLTLHADALEGTVLPTARAKLSAVRLDLVSHMKAQAATTRVGLNRTEMKRRLQRTLVEDHLRPIAAMAQSELDLSPRPAAFAVPHERARNAILVAAGYGLAEAATPHREALVAGGLKEDFIEQLIAATDALRDAASAAGQVVGARVEATALLKQRGRMARRYLRALDRIVRSGIKPHQALFGQWVRVSRVVSVAVTTAADVPGSGSGEGEGGDVAPVLPTTAVPDGNGGRDAAFAGVSGEGDPDRTAA